MAGKNYIVIASMRKYKVALEYLLNSLSPHECNIIIVYSDEPCDGVQFDGTMTIVTLKRNIYEYGAFFVPNMIEGVDDTDTFLLLHDTCHAGPCFKHKFDALCEVFREYQLDVLWCSPSGQCNICIYNKKCSVKFSEIWKDTHVVDKMEAIHIEHNNRHPYSLKSHQDLVQHYANYPNPFTGKVAVYGTHLRHRLYYTALDLEKYYVHVDRTEEHPQEP